MRAPRLVQSISSKQIAARVAELGRELAADFPKGDNDPPLWLVGALKGSLYFLADLSRALPREASIGFVRASSYGDGAESSGRVKIHRDADDPPEGADVVLVEDIIETGRTSKAILDYLAALRPRTLKVAALLDKPARRVIDVPIDYLGFEVPDRFVVGYGMDLSERYRNLPDIHYVEDL